MDSPQEDPGDITHLIERSRAGSADAEAQLFELLTDCLHDKAHQSLKRHGRDVLLQTTALVNEAWVKLLGNDAEYVGRDHFLAVAARAMRWILVDYCRRQKSAKRGGNMARLPIEEALSHCEEQSIDLIELDDALEQLALREERQAHIVELRFFAGLSIEETGRVLDVSHATVARDWRMARLWLMSELGEA